MALTSAESYVLTSPQGSVYDLASWVEYEQGVDFGDSWMAAHYAENPAADGGQFSFESIGVRTMRFPLLIASQNPGLLTVESQIRLAARPGATIDVKPANVASADAIRFDVLDGRWKPGMDRRGGIADYRPREQMISLRQGTLELDTQAWGYLPTMILLGSAASVGGPGVLALDTTKLIGDVPGYAEIFVAATSATSYGQGQKTDSVYWSLGARPSFQAFWPAASALGASYNPALVGDLYAPASQALRLYVPSTIVNQAQWVLGAAWMIPAALEPAYRGRHRAFSWCRLSPSQGDSWQLAFDVQPGSFSQALGSAQPIASVPPQTASQLSLPGAGGPSPAYSFVDLGEVSLPPVSSAPYETLMRLWVTLGTPNAAPTVTFDIGGLYLLPLGDAAGILPRGLIQPTWSSPSVLGRLHLSGISGDVYIGAPSSSVASPVPVALAWQNYRGLLPRVGASTLQLDLNIAGKQALNGAPTSQPPIRSEPHFAQVSVRYRPNFAFARGI